ncbi:MAG: 4Fe-4S binding protein [Pyramidobacter sp.]
MSMPQKMPSKTPVKRRVLGPCSYILSAAHTGTWRLERPSVDKNLCIRCGTCARYCPTACITVTKNENPLIFDWEYCKGCGICANECPKQALKMVPEGSDD